MILSDQTVKTALSLKPRSSRGQIWNDTTRAIYWAWYIIGLVLAIILILPFIVEVGGLEGIIPPCRQQTLYGTRCSLCGMTTAFYYISEGRLAEAYQGNHNALWLYALMVGNEIILIWHILKSYKRPKATDTRAVS